MTVKPASPSDGRAASAIAVSPYWITSRDRERAEDAERDQDVDDDVIPSARYIALGRSRAGFFRSPAVKVMTLNPR